MRILVTGVGSPPGLSLLRSLHQSTHSSLALYAGDAMAYSAGLYEPYLAGTIMLPKASDNAAYLNALLTYCQAQEIHCVVPCSEAEVSVLCHIRATWRDKYGIEVLVSSPDAVEAGVNKHRLAERLSTSPALSTIPTMLCRSLDDLDTSDIEYPCVIKPCNASGAKGVSYPSSTDELRHGVEQLLRQYGECLVQKYIAGPVNNIYTLGALYNQGQLIQTGLHHKLRTSPEIGGSATAGVTVTDDILSAFGIAVLEQIGGWHGFVAVEFKVDEPTKTPYILEINPRLWGFSYLMTQAGVNFGDIMVKSLLLHQPVVPQTYRRCAMVRSWQDIEVPCD